MEHGVFLDDEGIDLLLRRDAFLVPTLVAPVSVAEAVDLGVSLPASVREKLDIVLTAHEDSFRRALAAGVNIAMGSDSGIVPHGTNLRELELMVKYGMAPAAAFRAATSDAARLLGVDAERGSIEPGKRADLVVVTGDPLDFATLEDRIQAVYLDGRPAVPAR